MPEPAARLAERIRQRGPMPFAAFMEEALYGAGGYYARAEPPIGEDGDYVTGSTLSPLFGATTAKIVAALDRELGRPADVLEAGFGGGGHLRALLAALGDAAAPARRVLAWDRVARPAPPGAERLESLAALAPGEIQGLVFSYELFDALPVHRLIERPDGGLGELWVDLTDAGDFRWREGELSAPELAGLLEGALEPGQIADLAPGWRPLYRSLAERLGRGLLVTCDYGFDRRRLLDPRIRFHGTLACYRRHRVHRDPFVAVGRQDLTAHVDFSALVEEGEAAGLETAALTRQAAWLAATGLLEDLEDAPRDQRIEALRLMDLEGMGEAIRVLVQTRRVEVSRLVDRRLLELS